MTTTAVVGKTGESAAQRYLESKGLTFLDQHFQTRWGEIDLIFRDRGTWVFVEVKTRARRHSPSAADAITYAKQKRLINSALMYMKRHRLEGRSMRFDVVLLEAGRTEWLRDAFQAPPSSFTF